MLGFCYKSFAYWRKKSSIGGTADTRTLPARLANIRQVVSVREEPPFADCWSDPPRSKDLPFHARRCIRVNSHSQFDAVHPSAGLSAPLPGVTERSTE
jgi:hypothetical protein